MAWQQRIQKYWQGDMEPMSKSPYGTDRNSYFHLVRQEDKRNDASVPSVQNKSCGGSVPSFI